MSSTRNKQSYIAHQQQQQQQDSSEAEEIAPPKVDFAALLEAQMAAANPFGSSGGKSKMMATSPKGAAATRTFPAPISASSSPRHNQAEANEGNSNEIVEPRKVAHPPRSALGQKSVVKPSVAKSSSSAALSSSADEHEENKVAEEDDSNSSSRVDAVVRPISRKTRSPATAASATISSSASSSSNSDSGSQFDIDKVADPFGAQKTQLVGEDAPISGNRAAQAKMAKWNDENDENTASSSSSAMEEKSNNTTHSRRPVSRRRELDSSAAEHASEEDAADESSRPMPTAARSRPPPRAAAEFVETDDPFNSKAKVAMSTLGEDAPLSGMKGGAPMAWDNEQTPLEDGEQPTIPSRPPARARAARPVAARDDEDAESSAMGSDASMPTLPRRQPAAKAKAAAKEEKKAEPVSSKEASSSSGLASASAAPMKFEPYKGPALPDSAEARVTMAECELVTEETHVMLTSKKWNEQVEGLSGVTQRIEAMEASELVPLLPALFSLLMVTSGKAVNFNVGRALYELWAQALGRFVDSSLPASALPACCILTPLPDLVNKMSDAKLSESIQRLLSIFCVCFSFKFVLNHVVHIISAKEFKNVKAMESTLVAVHALVAEFGCYAVDLGQLVSQCQLWTGTANSVAGAPSPLTSKGIKEAAMAILLTVYKQTGPLFTEKLTSGLKPLLQKELLAQIAALGVADAEFVPERPSKSQRGCPIASFNLDALLPRADLSTLVSESFLKGLSDDKWTVRDEHLKQVSAFIRAHACRIKVNDGRLCEALGKYSLVDKNKNLARDALALVALLAQAMGKGVVAHKERLVPNLLRNLADSNKLVKEQALSTFRVWVEVAGVASVTKALPEALSRYPIARLEMLTVVELGLRDRERWKRERREDETLELVAPFIACLQDRITEVRTVAESASALLMAEVGYEAMNEALRKLKKAEVLKLQPVVDRIKKSLVSTSTSNRSGSVVQPAAAPAVVNDATKKKTEEKPAAKSAGASTGRASTAAGARSKTGTLKGGQLSGGVEEDVSDERASTSSSAVRKIDFTAKAVRVKRDAKRLKGAFREWGADEIEELHERASEFFSDAVMSCWSSKDFTKHVQLIDTLLQLLEQPDDEGVQALHSVLDLVFKFITWRLCDNINPTLLARALVLLLALLPRIRAQLHEGEANDIVPFFIEKVLGSGAKSIVSEAHKLFDLLLNMIEEKLMFAFLLSGLDSKSKKVQAEVIELMSKMWMRSLTQADNSASACALLNSPEGRRALHAVANAVGESDKDKRVAALDCLGRLHEHGHLEFLLATFAIGKSSCKVSATSWKMIDERFKRTKVITSAPQSHPQQPHDSSVGGGTPGRRVSPPVSAQASPAAALRALPLARPQPEALNHSYTVAAPPSSSSQASPPSIRPSTAFSLSRGRTSFTQQPLPGDDELPSCFSLDALDEHTSTAQPPSSTSSVSSTATRHSLGPSPSSSMYATLNPSLPRTSLRNSLQASPTATLSSTPLAPPAASSLATPLALPAFALSFPVVVQQLLVSRDADDRANGMKLVWEQIMNRKYASSPDEDDSLVSYVTFQVIADSFREDARGALAINHRYCRYGLNVIMELYKVRGDFSVRLRLRTLSSLLHLLLSKLCDERLKSPGDDQQHFQLMQAINVLVVKVLENADRTFILHILIGGIGRAPASPAATSSSYAGLLSRCLSKLIQLLQQQGMQRIDLRQLWRDLDAYFGALSPEQMARAMSAPADHSSSLEHVLFRSVRSVLSLTVQVLGEPVLKEPYYATLSDNSRALVERTIRSWKEKQAAKFPGVDCSFMAGSQEFTSQQLIDPFMAREIAEEQQEPPARTVLADIGVARVLDGSNMQSNTPIVLSSPSLSASLSSPAASVPSQSQGKPETAAQEIVRLLESAHSFQEGSALLKKYASTHPTAADEILPPLAANKTMYGVAERIIARVRQSTSDSATAAGTSLPQSSLAATLAHPVTTTDASSISTLGRFSSGNGVRVGLASSTVTLASSSASPPSSAISVSSPTLLTSLPPSSAPVLGGSAVDSDNASYNSSSIKARLANLARMGKGKTVPQ